MKYPDSGLYHYCLNLGDQIKKVLDADDRGEKIMYYVPPREKDSFKAGRACIIEKNWHSKYFKPFLWNCDIWHAPFQSGRLIPTHTRRTKVVLTVHDLNVLHEDKPDKERVESLQRTQKLINASHAIICISEHTKSDVLKNLEVRNKPLYVIHNGTHHIAGAPASPKGYRPYLPFVFTMGYVNRKKNFHTLLALLKDPELELVVAGKLDEPEYVAAMKKQAWDLGVSDRLRILGPVSEEDKAWYFRNCRAFALPSLAEGFGAPVVEAMKFGKPLFLSDRTSLPEIGGDVSFYFSNFDPDHMYSVYKAGMKEYMKNGLSQRIMKRGQSFSWEEKAREYVKVYRSLYE
jgi:glycosyltransferase involved in cell wall biosynthesis